MKKSVVIAVSLLMLTGFDLPDGDYYSFPDYFPIDSRIFCIKTFEQSIGGAGRVTVEISGECLVPYKSGTLSGVTIQEVDGTSCYANDGNEVRLLSWDQSHISSDCDLTDHPNLWRFGAYQFGPEDEKKIRLDGDYYLVNDICTPIDNLSILVDFQPVVISFREDNFDAAILWYLDEATAFSDLDLQGAALDVTLPSLDDTGDYAITGFDIFVYGFGLIASGWIDAASGELDALYSLVALNCDIDEGDSCGCSVFKAAGDPGLLQLTVSGMLYLLPAGFAAACLRGRRRPGLLDKR
ncbi:hypothetical protein ACFL4G_12580 [Thermodesulfobacteriota bacterium]